MIFYKKISSQELIRVYSGLASLLKAGISLPKALVILEGQVGTKNLKQIIRSVLEEIGQGKSLSQALEQHPKVFSSIIRGLVMVGESGGILDQTLEECAKYLERTVHLTASVKSALIYPMFVLGISLASIIFLVYFLLPTLGGLFQEMGVPLPGLTQFMFNLGWFVTNYAPFIFGGLLVLIIGVVIFMKDERGKAKIERLILKVPVIGKFIQELILLRTTQALGILLDGGVALRAALVVTADSASNCVFRTAYYDLKEDVEQGMKIAQSMEARRVFPRVLKELVSAGEESGQLGSMFRQAAEYYEREVEHATKKITTLISPIATLIVSCIVGMIVVAMFLPIINMMDALSM